MNLEIIAILMLAFIVAFLWKKISDLEAKFEAHKREGKNPYLK